MNIKQFQNFIKKSLAIFFFGMIGQFLAHTIVMYGFKLPQISEFIWLWKEIIIWILWLWSIYIFRNHKDLRNNFFHNKNILLIIGIIIGSMIISLWNSIVIHNQNIMTFLVSAKFNYIPLIILCCGLFISQIINKEQYETILNIIITTIKYVLVFSLLWYGILHTIPNILDRIGFAQPGDSIERAANTPPPSLYLTEFYSWYVRNQWPFWWPLSLWFYLIWLWPLFFAKVLYQKKLSDTRWRRILYISIVLSTYSRAAWGMFFISSLAIALIIYRKYTKYIIWTWILSVIILLGYLKSWGTSEMFVRTRSDKWHLEYFTQWIQLVQQNRLRWLWASSVWPWSNHIEWVTKVFNPENQYMQIWLEYGLLWLLWRLLAYFIIAKNSIKKWFSIVFWDNIYKKEDIMFIGIGLSILSLWIWGMVLHPFADSSSMYPFMMMSWIILWTYNFIPTIWEKKTTSITTQVREKILCSWKLRTIIISMLFTIQTFFVSWLGIISNTIIISTIRDLLFWWIALLTLWYWRLYIISFIRKHYIITTLSIILFITNIIYILSNIHSDILHIIAWIKYDIYFVIILLLSLWFWYIIQKNNQWKIISSYIQWLWEFIVILIWWWLLWQIFKTVYPSFFVDYMWFSTPSDFVPFSKPPIYYITWSWWIQRLSGFFVWPNTLGFFMILFTSLLYYQYKNIIKKAKNRRIIVLYLAIIISTMSRWVIIGITIQCIILILFENYIIWKEKLLDIIFSKQKIIILTTAIIISFFSFLWINQRKQDSNTERFWALSSSLELVSEVSFFGNGPGYVWPAKHYDHDYNLNKKNNLSMLENIYLQLLINQWMLWLIIFIWIVLVLFKYHNKIRIKLSKNIISGDDYVIYSTVQYLWIGLLSLLWVWWFLHIFIDSMINYLFFIIYWISLWYVTSDQYE